MTDAAGERLGAIDAMCSRLAKLLDRRYPHVATALGDEHLVSSLAAELRALDGLDLSEAGYARFASVMLRAILLPALAFSTEEQADVGKPSGVVIDDLIHRETATMAADMTSIDRDDLDALAAYFERTAVADMLVGEQRRRQTAS